MRWWSGGEVGALMPPNKCLQHDRMEVCVKNTAHDNVNSERRLSSLPIAHVVAILVMLALPGCRLATDAPSGCTRDSDCKGERVCSDGTCTAPGAPSPPSRSPAPPMQGSGASTERVRIQPPAGIARAIARSGPALDASEVGRVPAGEEVQVIEKTNDGRWFRVRHSALAAQNGWIHRDVLVVGGEPPRPRRPRPVADPPGGCELDGITYDAQGRVWGCGPSGGNWCAKSPPLAGGCRR